MGLKRDTNSKERRKFWGGLYAVTIAVPVAFVIAASAAKLPYLFQPDPNPELFDTSGEVFQVAEIDDGKAASGITPEQVAAADAALYPDMLLAGNEHGRLVEINQTDSQSVPEFLVIGTDPVLDNSTGKLIPAIGVRQGESIVFQGDNIPVTFIGRSPDGPIVLGSTTPESGGEIAAVQITEPGIYRVMAVNSVALGGVPANGAHLSEDTVARIADAARASSVSNQISITVHRRTN